MGEKQHIGRGFLPFLLTRQITIFIYSAVKLIYSNLKKNEKTRVLGTCCEVLVVVILNVLHAERLL